MTLSICEFTAVCLVALLFFRMLKRHADVPIYAFFAAPTAYFFFFVSEVSLTRKVAVSAIYLWFYGPNLNAWPYVFYWEVVKHEFGGIQSELQQRLDTASDDEPVTPDQQDTITATTPPTEDAIPPSQEPVSVTTSRHEAPIPPRHPRASTSATPREPIKPSHQPVASRPKFPAYHRPELSDAERRRRYARPIIAPPRPKFQLRKRTHPIDRAEFIEPGTALLCKDPRPPPPRPQMAPYIPIMTWFALAEGLQKHRAFADQLLASITAFYVACFQDPTLNWREPMDSIRGLLVATETDLVVLHPGCLVSDYQERLG
ncbi:hypothetical protein K491DRAFT_385233 [Lophiostoma macrostomum CBS 122681]|uniref:Uncharacterized protein n=1 Tax=Lophiostoma macrostomum CBS 122681 TaxID=1314788 RepID=A0A6A6TS81_9PLEO|nr:hypothetical protein K491DRAFT_385233 [Lophiostoma macrostomum CBS 122681]